jgi:hypothetical protein
LTSKSKIPPKVLHPTREVGEERFELIETLSFHGGVCRLRVTQDYSPVSSSHASITS